MCGNFMLSTISVLYSGKFLKSIKLLVFDAGSNATLKKQPNYIKGLDIVNTIC